MKNFKPGGLRNRRPDLGGRPKSDINSYAPKRRFDDRAERFGGKSDRYETKGNKLTEKFAATCTSCGNKCEVPFRPDGTKPVLCRDCYVTKNASPTNSNTSRDRFTPNELKGRPERAPEVPRANHSSEYALIVKQLSSLEIKVNQLMDMVKSAGKPVTSEVKLNAAAITEPKTEDTIATTKERKPKKTTREKVAKKATKKVPAKAKKAAKKTK